MQDIAKSSQGVFVKATSANLGLGLIMKKIQELEKKKIETTIATDFNDQFRIFFFIAFFILIFDLFLSERKSQMWKKLNLFNESKSS